MPYKVRGPKTRIHKHCSESEHPVVNLATVETQHHKVTQPRAVMRIRKTDEILGHPRGGWAPSIMFNAVFTQSTSATKQSWTTMLEPSSSSPTIPHSFPDSRRDSRRDQPLQVHKGSGTTVGCGIGVAGEIPPLELFANSGNWILLVDLMQSRPDTLLIFFF